MTPATRRALQHSAEELRKLAEQAEARREDNSPGRPAEVRDGWAYQAKVCRQLARMFGRLAADDSSEAETFKVGGTD